MGLNVLKWYVGVKCQCCSRSSKGMKGNIFGMELEEGKDLSKLFVQSCIRQRNP